MSMGIFNMFRQKFLIPSQVCGNYCISTTSETEKAKSVLHLSMHSVADLSRALCKHDHQAGHIPSRHRARFQFALVIHRITEL